LDDDNTRDPSFGKRLANLVADAGRASSDEECLSFGVEFSLQWRDPVVSLAVVGLDLSRPELQEILEIVRRHIVSIRCY